jgi:hypothetical protein
MIYYLDSSAWLKRYFKEQGPAAVQRLFADAGNMLAVCRLGMVEVASAIARRASRENFEPRAIEQQVAIARRDYEMMARMDWSESLWASAETLGVKHRMRAGDAMHLAAALLARPSSENVVLVSADQELLAAVATEGLATLDPACA